MTGNTDEMGMKLSALMKELADISDDLDEAGRKEAALMLDEAYAVIRKAQHLVRKEVA